MNNDFLKNWEPEVVKPKEADSTCAGMSSLCKACKNLDEDGVCEVRGFQMEMAPPVYACMEWKTAPEKDEDKAEILRTFTLEVTQMLRVARSEAGRAERSMKEQTDEELERAAAAALGAENVKVRDVKVWVLD